MRADGRRVHGERGVRSSVSTSVRRHVANGAMAALCIVGAGALAWATVRALPSAWSVHDKAAAGPGGQGAAAAGPESPKDPYTGNVLPFQPVLPESVPSGYKLVASGVIWERRGDAPVFKSFEAQYRNPAVRPYTGPQVIDVREYPGEAVVAVQVLGSAAAPAVSPRSSSTLWAGGSTYHMHISPGSTVHLDSKGRPMRVHGQTYYVSDGWPSWVGFVRNHVVYFLSVPYDHWSQRLLACAEKLNRPAAVQWSQRYTAGTLQEAAGNVSFQPIVPSLGTAYVGTGVGSQVFWNEQSRSEYAVFDYRSRSHPGVSAQVVEMPLANAINPYAAAVKQSSPSTGPSLVVWKDTPHQLLWVLHTSLPKDQSEALMAKIRQAAAGQAAR